MSLGCLLVPLQIRFPHKCLGTTVYLTRPDRRRRGSSTPDINLSLGIRPRLLGLCDIVSRLVILERAEKNANGQVNRLWRAGGWDEAGFGLTGLLYPIIRILSLEKICWNVWEE